MYLPGRQISSEVLSFLNRGIQVTFLLYCKHLGFFSMILREAPFIERRGEQKWLRLLVLYELYDSKRAVDRLVGAELCESVNL